MNKILGLEQTFAWSLGSALMANLQP
jgi:hypothetical protein